MVKPFNKYNICKFIVRYIVKVVNGLYNLFYGGVEIGREES